MVSILNEGRQEVDAMECQANLIATLDELADAKSFRSSIRALNKTNKFTMFSNNNEKESTADSAASVVKL